MSIDWELLSDPLTWRSPDLRRPARTGSADRPSLVLCGNGMSGEAVVGLSLAGFDCVVLTEFPHDRGLEHAAAIIPVDTKNPAAVRSKIPLIQRLIGRPAGVFSLCWDCPESVAVLTEHFALPGCSVEVARAASDKSTRRALLAAAGVRIPGGFVCTSSDDCVSQFRNARFDEVVCKPRQLSSSRGVSVARDERELMVAYAHAANAQASPHVVVEQYVRGTEHSMEGIAVDGDLHVTGFSDRQFAYGRYFPHFVEIGDVLPSALDGATIDQIEKLVAAGSAALGITDGPVKADIIVSTDGVASILEITPRLGGPRFGTEVVPLHNGVSVLQAVTQFATATPVEITRLRPIASRGVVLRSLLGYPTGTFDGLTGLAAAATIPGFYDFKPWPPGGLDTLTTLSRPQHGCGEVGYFICSAPNREAALATAAAIEDHLHISVR